MTAFMRTTSGSAPVRLLGVWLWMFCLILGSTGVLLAGAPKLLDQYTASRD